MTASLWDFALDFYGRPGISAACLTLQDEAGLDVVHLITVVYADRIGRRLDAAAIADLGTAMADWRAGAVLPLRAARRFLKAPLPGLEADKDALRQAVKAAELKAEQLQLAMGQAWLEAHPPRTGGLPPARAIETLLGRPPGAAAAGEQAQQAVAAILSAWAGLGPA